MKVLYDDHKCGTIKNINSRATECTPDFLVGSVLLIFLIFCVVLLCVFTFWVPCCGVRYNFRIKTMFGSSLPSVVLSTLFVFLFYLPLSCVPYLASFSGFSISECPFGIRYCLFIYNLTLTLILGSLSPVCLFATTIKFQMPTPQIWDLKNRI
jgi:hypothetical protein